MGKSPAFQFYPDDHLSDPNIHMLSNEELGAYFKLLCFAWKANEVGHLLNDDEFLSKLTGLCEEKWKAYKQNILRCFEVKDNFIIQKRLVREFEKQKDYRKQKVKAGKTGATKRWQNHSRTIAEPCQSHSKTIADDKQTHSKGLAEPKQKIALHTSYSILQTPVLNTPVFHTGGEEVSSPKVQPAETIPKPKKTHHYLELFKEEYRRAKGVDYLIGNFAIEGGMAKGLEAKVPEVEVVKRSMRAYLEASDKRIVESGHSFSFYVRDINRWVSKGITHEPKPDKYDHLYVS